MLAGLVGRSESWLSQLERGKRGVDSHSVLVRLAEILRVDIEELTGSADRDETGRHAYPAAPLIEQAMMGYGAPGPVDGGDEPGREASLDFLLAQARSAYQAYQATRYDAAGRILPGLIRDVETVVRTEGSASLAACAVRARVYDTAAALLSRVGEPFLAWAAADRAMFAAEQSGDPLLAAASAWRMSYMITGRKHPQEALDLAMAAAAALERRRGRHRPNGSASTVPCTWPPPPRQRPASTRPRHNHCWPPPAASLTALARRTTWAPRLARSTWPSTPSRRRSSSATPRAATETGEALDIAAMPVGLVGRRTRVNLDLARAYAMTRKDAAAVNLLLAAERLSPQLVRYNPATRDVLTELLRREHRPSTPELRPLARRAGVI